MNNSNLKQRKGKPRSAGFQTCCIAGFQTRNLLEVAGAADLEVGDTAGLETCATKTAPSCARPALTSEVLILPDGQVLAHNLTPVLAALLGELNPEDPQFTSRNAASARLTQPATRNTIGRARTTTRPEPHP